MHLGCVLYHLADLMIRVLAKMSHRKSEYEPPHDKTNNVAVRPAKTQIRPVWSESSLSAWRKLGSLAIHWAHSEDSDQTGWMPRLIWVFGGRTFILLVLSWGGSYAVRRQLMVLNERCTDFLFTAQLWVVIYRVKLFDCKTLLSHRRYEKIIKPQSYLIWMGESDESLCRI